MLFKLATDLQWSLVGKFRDPGRNKSFEEVRLSQFYFTPFASDHVIFIHIGEASFELKGHTLAHHSNAIYCIHPGLRLRLK